MKQKKRTTRTTRTASYTLDPTHLSYLDEVGSRYGVTASWLLRKIIEFAKEQDPEGGRIVQLRKKD